MAPRHAHRPLTHGRQSRPSWEGKSISYLVLLSSDGRDGLSCAGGRHNIIACYPSVCDVVSVCLFYMTAGSAAFDIYILFYFYFDILLFKRASQAAIEIVDRTVESLDRCLGLESMVLHSSTSICREYFWFKEIDASLEKKKRPPFYLFVENKPSSMSSSASPWALFFISANKALLDRTEKGE